MKKLLVTALLVAGCVGAYAQGKIQLVNDSVHVVYFGTLLRPADAALAGTGIPQVTATPSGATFTAGLFGANPASGSNNMTLVTTYGFSNSGQSAGRIAANNALGAQLTAAVANWFQVRVWETSFGSYAAALAGNGYVGESTIFTTVPGSGTLYNSIANVNSPALTTWARGTHDMGGGIMGAISVQLVPEPSTFALAGLGAAAMLIFRRRK